MILGAFCVLTAALSAFRLGASGGELLVPPRSSARMRLKEALKGLLPQTNPPSLRILPARFLYREAGVRRFLRKHPRIQPIPCQCAHWRGIEDHFDFWKRLPVAIAFCRFFSVLTKCALEKSNPMGASDHAVSKCSDRRIFRAGSALAQTLFLLRPGRFLRGAVRRAANLIYDCQWQSHLDSSALPTAPPLSRVLSPFLGGTRKEPPEGYPAEIFNRASVRTSRLNGS